MSKKDLEIFDNPLDIFNWLMKLKIKLKKPRLIYNG